MVGTHDDRIIDDGENPYAGTTNKAGMTVRILLTDNMMNNNDK